MSDCIFCKIVAGTIPGERVAENDEFICVRDIHPQAPVHVLVIPKKHVESLAHAATRDGAVEELGRLMVFAAETAKRLGLDAHGYRTVLNTGKGGGQVVFHLHVHLLGNLDRSSRATAFA